VKILVVIGVCALLSGCLAGGYGYSSGPGYYESGGVDYGGWGGGYRVGPNRGGDHEERGVVAASHGHASAPASRSAPSIPSGSRAGGSRGGSHSR
jgi:hypothetical protein